MWTKSRSVSAWRTRGDEGLGRGQEVEDVVCDAPESWRRRTM